jgi:REP element-mobilizing transposase RayT
MRSRQRQVYEIYSNLYFVTSTIVGFANLFDIDECRNILLKSFKFCQSRGDFTIIGYVIMPNHFHLIAHVGQGYSISKIVGNIKRFTSHEIVKYLQGTSDRKLLETLALFAADEPSADCRVWKPRFDCLTITDVDILRQKLEYIHHNPVRRGLAPDPLRYRHSSARNYSRLGEIEIRVDVDWRSLEHGNEDSVRRDS